MNIINIINTINITTLINARNNKLHPVNSCKKRVMIIISLINKKEHAIKDKNNTFMEEKGKVQALI